MKYFLTMLGAGLIATAATANPRDVVDTLQRAVTIPENPQRIISTNEPALTIPLIELGIEPVGSLGRNDDGSYQFGADFIIETFGQNTPKPKGFGLNGQIDLEKLRELKPDLILGTELDAAKVDQFTTVAPVYLQSFLSGDLRNFALEKNLADVIGRQEAFDTLRTAYDGRISETKNGLGTDPTGQSYLMVMVTDQLSAIGNGTGTTQALEDLGFVRFDLDQNGKPQPPLMLKLSPESFGKMNPDLLVLVGSWAKADRGEAAVNTALSAAMPGWETYLTPALENRVIYLDSAQIFTPTFASANHTLDAVEAWAKTRTPE